MCFNVLFIKYINWVQLIGIQIHNLDIARIKNQRNEIQIIYFSTQPQNSTTPLEHASVLSKLSQC